MNTSLLSLLVSCLSLTISIVFSLITLRSKRSSDRQAIYAQFQVALNSLIDISNEWHALNNEPEEHKKKISFTEKINGLQLKKAALADRAHNLALGLGKLISQTEYTELAKSFYSLGAYERAERYHLLAIRAASDPLGIAAKRSYADFLFCSGRAPEGRDRYKNSMIIQTTDINKAINAKTLQMWMYNEGKIGNHQSVMAIYNEAASVIDQIGDLHARKDKKQELDNVRNSL